ncbi:MAG: dUTP diphosphatase [Rectinemataceae bacterium]
MNHLTVRFSAEPGAVAPEYRSSGAAGADLRAKLDNPLLIAPLERVLVPTGLRIELPEGYEAQVRPRSGLAVEMGIGCLNSPGTIDSDYRGEIKVLLVNFGSKPARIANGDRIAQLVVAPCARADFIAADSLSESERGSGGFGSTGR